MRVRPHVCAAALACLSLLAISPEEGPGNPAPRLLAGKPVHADSSPASRPLAVQPRAPACAAGNPHGDFGLVAVIARPRDAAPRMDANAFRGLVSAADGLVYQQAEESGAPGADLVFDCDASGAVRVDEVALPTPLSKTTFDSVVADLGALGYDRQNEKYVVWLDGKPPTAACGSADIVSDQEPGDGNRVAIGPDWAVSFGCNSILHETMHVLGGVGFGARHGTGTGHCWDGSPVSDVMCYDDGGPSIPRGGVRSACSGPALHLDCGHDDYFAAGPVPASSYLASHWNVAGCYDRFVLDYGCPGIASREAAPPVLRVVARRRTANGGSRLTFRLSGPPFDGASVAYRSAAGAGRLVFARGRVTATLDVAPPRTSTSRGRLTFSDPRGLWLRDALVSLP